MKEVFDKYREQIERARKEHGKDSDSTSIQAATARAIISIGLPPMLYYETKTRPPNLTAEEKEDLVKLIDEVDEEMGSRF